MSQNSNDSTPESDLRKIEAWAEKHRRRLVRVGRNHYRIGRVNYYLSTGTFYEDGEPRKAEKGVDALLDFLDGKPAAVKLAFIVPPPPARS